MTRVLAIAHFCKGEKLLQAFQELGCKTTLLSRADLKEKPWPRHLVEELFFVYDFRDQRDVLKAVSYLHQDRDFQIVAPLDEYAVGTCARVRSHLACPGLCEGTTRKVRDKLVMRCVAESRGIPVPQYCGFNNKRRINDLLQQCGPPWMVKPRAAGGSVRIKKLDHSDEIWELYRSLGDKRSFHLIEEYLPSVIFHVDSIVHQGDVLLEVAGRYATPPFDVWHGGGVFAATTVPRDDSLSGDLLSMNREVIEAMGIVSGVNHAEFLKHGDDLYFLEIAARVPGSNLDQLATAATGVDLYLESARIQLCAITGEEYLLPEFEYREAGLVQCLAREKTPDLGEFANLSELVWTLTKDHHIGLSYAAPQASRVRELTDQILTEFGERHLAVLPASETPA